MIKFFLGVRCELQGLAGHSLCLSLEACVCYQESQAHGSEMVIKYWVFLEALTVLSPQCTDGLALGNHSETRAHHFLVTISYLAVSSH